MMKISEKNKQTPLICTEHPEETIRKTTKGEKNVESFMMKVELEFRLMKKCF